MECISGLKGNKEHVMKILLFCCKGFEMMEFSPFVDVMGWAVLFSVSELYIRN